MAANSNSILLQFICGVATVAAAPAAHAQAQSYDFDLGRQDLDASLKAVGRVTGNEVMYPTAAVNGVIAPALKGRFSLEQAVRQLLAGTHLVAEYRPQVILIRRSPVSETARDTNSTEAADIVVTGSRIRGGEPLSPIIVASRREIEDRGFTDLGQFARDLVQNYSGGQNPGVAGGGQGGSANLTSSSTLNLRGLGADATLTLFNGHRVAYDAFGQGIDISAIPLAAVERVETVTDGSSALYGSDAVGGVANVILRRDYDGATASARFGAATDGGDVEQQYDLVAGKKWRTGGLIAAFDYRHVTPINAGERSYTQNIYPTATLVNGQNKYGVVVAAHQQLTDTLTFEIDGSFSDRKNIICINFTAAANCFTNGGDVTTHTQSWSISPSLHLQLNNGWQVRLSGTSSKSKADNRTNNYIGGVLGQRVRAIYTNRLSSVEFSAEGPLFELPGGPARLAAGAGFRDTQFQPNAVAVIGGARVPVYVFSVDRQTYFGYGEISLPIVGERNEIPWIERLTVTGAVRYEENSGAGKVATPKLGVIYAPSRDLALKLSWGKSFKAPTLFQTGQPLLGVSELGSSFSPPSPVPGTVLSLFGGNPNLKPERATSLTATATLTPRFIDGLRIDVSYFHIKYRDRVVTPMTSDTVAFLPQNSDFITLAPTRDQIQSAISALSLPVVNQGGGDVTKANVVAIVTNYLQNAARQTIDGVDVAAEYRVIVGQQDEIKLGAAASYLESNQQLTSAQPVIQLAGTIFRPPHWRARSSVDWTRGSFSLNGTFSYIGGLLDNRRQPFADIRSFKSFDLTARLKSTDTSGVFSGVTASLSVLNLFNEKPGYARTTTANGFQYDSTNYPSIGRFVSFSLAKSF